MVEWMQVRVNTSANSNTTIERSHSENERERVTEMRNSPPIRSLTLVLLFLLFLLILLLILLLVLLLMLLLASPFPCFSCSLVSISIAKRLAYRHSFDKRTRACALCPWAFNWLANQQPSRPAAALIALASSSLHPATLRLFLISQEHASTMSRAEQRERKTHTH